MSMSQNRRDFRTDDDTIPNGSGAAAILAAGIGCAAVGILAFAGDASDAIGRLLNFFNPDWHTLRSSSGSSLGLP